MKARIVEMMWAENGDVKVEIEVSWNWEYEYVLWCGGL
jgi:hypothetical protein